LVCIINPSKAMQNLMLLGDEAIAQAALDAGISGIYAYPGTPSTEITEYVQRSKTARDGKVHSEWSANEKTAMEAALGMSYAGKRSMVCMKHVGLNVAADPFMNSSITGVNGGMVVVVADDPSMHSSQNEQDSRVFGKFAMIPVFEPANQQESYDLTYGAFDLSEKYRIPVMLRLTTRLAHSRSGVVRSEAREQNSVALPENPNQFILLPSLARNSYQTLLGHQDAFETESDRSPFNLFVDGRDRSVGIVVCGLAYNYLIENFKDHAVPHPVLKISQYPLPRKKLAALYDMCESILVIEEGYPVVEELLAGVLGGGKKIRGRLEGTLPRAGELTPDLVGLALGYKTKKIHEIPDILASRPPALCKGCSHADVYHALNEVMEPYGAGRVFSDIGCYTLGALPPFNAIHSCVDMGASVTMAKGAADAGLVPAVCVIGDSTFTHSGMTGLLDAVLQDSPITVIISDNSTTAMTGGQVSHATGRLESICEGLGVHRKHIRTLHPLKKYHGDNVLIIKEEIAYRGVSVIIAQRECIQTATRQRREVRKESSKHKNQIQ
jgi:indolepyruvate ferredoxin oxidoreductase alpha subunit